MSFVKGNIQFMRKIPIGAEASSILVGHVDFLEHPISAFVRLSRAVFLSDLTEVPIPSRFIFLLLGPVVSLHQSVGTMVGTYVRAAELTYVSQCFYCSRRNWIVMKWDDRWLLSCRTKYFTRWRTKREIVITFWLPSTTFWTPSPFSHPVNGIQLYG